MVPYSKGQDCGRFSKMQQPDSYSREIVLERNVSLMCGRYVRRSDKQRIAEHFAVHGPTLPDFGPSWNVAPQTFQPVVRLNRDTGERELVLMRWGLVPYWILLANSGRATEVS